MEGGGGRKLNVIGFLSYLNQEKFRLAETIYVPCAKAEKLFYCDAKAKCPRMRELIHGQWLMMNGNTEFVEEGQSQHPCYRMYKHDHSNFDGYNAWIQWFGTGNINWYLRHNLFKELPRANDRGQKQVSIDVNWLTVFSI